MHTETKGVPGEGRGAQGSSPFSSDYISAATYPVGVRTVSCHRTRRTSASAEQSFGIHWHQRCSAGRPSAVAWRWAGLGLMERRPKRHFCVSERFQREWRRLGRSSQELALAPSTILKGTREINDLRGGT